MEVMMSQHPFTSLGTRTLVAHGSCTLVGAGPGDPELLTLKALKAIQNATVLFVDDLVNEAIVAHAAPTARIVYVGKRGGCKSTPQAFIEKLMITAVREGERVVRLKGGDPFIFGRGGEEVEHLQQAGIPVSVINGITSGLAAVTSLGVPLTHRDHAHGVLFLTGHAKPGDSGPDWTAIAATARAAKLTLVIYMGVSGAQQIEHGLLSGLPGDTPVALIRTPRCRRSATPSARWPNCTPRWCAKNSAAPASSWWATCCKACCNSSRKLARPLLGELERGCWAPP
jgi:uroporphyrin-III C-methyltransferase